MVAGRGALARWRAHLEEVIGVDDAADVVDPFATVAWEDLATSSELLALRADIDGLGAELAAFQQEMRTDIKDLRRDLLRVTAAQFFALAAAVGALAGFS